MGGGGTGNVAVLCVATDPEAAAVVDRALGRAVEEPVAVEHERDADGAVAAATGVEFDCVVCAGDVETGAVDLVETLRDRDLPVVLFADADPAVLSEAVAAGVAEFVPRSASERRLADRVLAAAADDRTGEPPDRSQSSRRFRQLEALHDVALELDDCERRGQVYRVAVDAAEEVLDLDACTVFVEENGTLYPKAASEGLVGGAIVPYDLDEGLVGRTWQEGRPFRTDDAGANPEAAPATGEIASGITAPLGSFGVLASVSTERAAFDDVDVRFLDLLGRHVAAAVDRIEHDEIVRRERDRFASLFENVPDAAVITDADARIVDANPAFEETFGFDREAVVGEPVSAVVVPEGGSRVDLTDAVEDDAVVAREVTRKTTDGPREFLLRGFAVEDGDAAHTCAIYTDITERTERERQLRTLHDGTRRLMGAEEPAAIAAVASELAADILDLPINGVYLYDAEEEALSPVAVSERARELFGSPPSFGAGDGLAWEVFADGGTATYGDVREQSDAYNPETPVRSEAILSLGEHGVLFVGSTRPDDLEESTVALAKVLASNLEAALDRADRERELERRRERLERQNERLDRFASTVSHDLRNPLTLARGRAELAREAAEGEAVDHVEEIEWALDRMGALVDELLTLARSGRRVTDPEPVALGDAVDHARRSTSCPVEVVDDLPTVEADRDRLLVLFENLFRNAADHGGPDVTVRVGATADGFYVADDGPGIPPDERESVFESGYTTGEGGSGLGLSIVDEVVQAHGWSIGVAESADGGARFEVAVS